jgi:predicted transglutaminase-like cysteine proteinase
MKPSAARGKHVSLFMPVLLLLLAGGCSPVTMADPFSPRAVAGASRLPLSDVMRRHESQLSGDRRFADEWARKVARFAAMPEKDRIRAINSYANRHAGVADVVDEWKTPQAVMVGGGDCEDVAILKHALLLASGMPKDRSRLVVVQVPAGAHAVLAVSTDEGTLILDNLKPEPFRPTDARDYRVLLATGADGPGFWFRQRD